MVQRIMVGSGSSAVLGEDYVAAVVRVATAEHGDSRRLLMATAELVPRGCAAPRSHIVREDVYGPDRRLRYAQGGVGVAESLALLRGAATEGILDLGRLTIPGLAALGRVSTGAMLEEPRWPGLVLATEAVAPFLAGWHGQPRMHHLLAAAPPRAEDPVERQRWVAWLSGHFFFHAEEFPEYVGSAHLVAPNPRYAAMRMRLVADPGRAPGEGVVLCFVPRPGDDLHGLSVRVTAARPTGVFTSHEIEVTEPLVRVDFEHQVARVGADVFDRERGLLERDEPSWFLRSFGVSVTTVEAGRIPASGAGSADVEVPPRSALEALQAAVSARATRTAARARTLFEARDERWRLLRGEILQGAHRYLLVVTPALRTGDLEVLRAWAREGASHTFVLVAEPPGWGRLPDADPSQMPRYVEVRVAPSGSGPQGSFLVTDRRAWSFTGACSALGEEGTFLQEIPDSKALHDRFFTAWHEATPWGCVAADERHEIDLAALLNEAVA